MMGCGFDSESAKLLNKQIFESIYYAAVSESIELAKIKGAYSLFEGSPFSKGKLQFHLWGLSENDLLMGYDWKSLIADVKKYGTRNSLLTVIMPTASSSQIMGNSECCEPRMSNVFTRTTIAGMFIIVNPFLMNDLMSRGLWSEDMRKKLIIYNGSVQQIDEIPIDLKKTYKTAFELDQMHLVEQSADRGIFIDQSQSFNVFSANPSFDLQTAVLFGGWRAGLKTGQYYLRTQPAVPPIQFGIDIDDVKRLTGKNDISDFIFDQSSNSVISTTSTENKNSDQSKEAVCMWKPGMAPADCLVCSS
jgi:ribonucleotide reductase alpha subunit